MALSERQLLASNGGLALSDLIGFPGEWRTREEAFWRAYKSLLLRRRQRRALGAARSRCTYVLAFYGSECSAFHGIRDSQTCGHAHKSLAPTAFAQGLDFVGPHHLRTRWGDPFIWTLPVNALDWIDAIGESNVGLLFDAYHWYTNGLTVADIEALRADQIVMFISMTRRMFQLKKSWIMDACILAKVSLIWQVS